MGRKGFYYDQTRCVGCNACQIACKDYHDLEKDLVYRRVSTWEMDTEDGKTICLHYSGACNHCTDALCVKNCPVHAFYRREDGTVVQDKGACIGCGTCTWACPYGAPALNRMSGTSVKCDGCADRRALGKDPVCVEACITHCLQFGDLEELSRGHDTVREMPFLPVKDITDPAITIRPRIPADGADLPKDLPVQTAEKTEKFSLEGKKILILGGGIAGVTAAETVRRLSSDAEITILTEEDEFPYSRPLLSKTYIKSLDVSKVLIKPEQWYADKRINIEKEAVITGINPEQKTVTLKDGRVFAYDSCIYALGAAPWTPPMEGLPMNGVYCVRTADDMDQIHRYMSVSKEAIVLGGGVIGLEMAEELKQMGLSVTILEAAPRLMGRLLDAESSGVLKNRLISEGFRVEEGVSAARVNAEKGRLSSVTLKDGREIHAGVMVVSCGIRANIALAQSAGIVCERGVVVNGKMETSAAGVYAAGDCISLNGRNPGLWGFSKDTAELAGMSAVYALAGKMQKEESCMFNADVMMSTGGISVFASGSLEEGEDAVISYRNTEKEKKDFQEFASVASHENRFLVNHRNGEDFRYGKFFRRNGKLVGAVLMGDLSDLAEVKEELREGGKEE